jgi:hypothetical protein
LPHVKLLANANPLATGTTYSYNRVQYSSHLVNRLWVETKTLSANTFFPNKLFLIRSSLALLCLHAEALQQRQTRATTIFIDAV